MMNVKVKACAGNWSVRLFLSVSTTKIILFLILNYSLRSNLYLAKVKPQFGFSVSSQRCVISSDMKRAKAYSICSTS